EVNLRAKIQSHKTRDRNKPVDQKSHTQIPGRQIFTAHKFSPNKTSAVYEKISPRSDLRDGENLNKMKENGDECIFVGYSTQSKAYRVFNKRTRVIMESIHVNFEELPLMASDQNSSNPAPECQIMASVQNNSDPAPECQTMVSDQLSSDPAPECQNMALNHDSLSPANQRQANVTQADRTVTMSNELDLLFSPMFDELLNGSSKVVSKSSAVSATDAPNQYDEFINIFSTPVQDQGETSSRHVDLSNMQTFYQRFPFEHRWTKDHPLEQVIGNPLQPVRTRRQLESDAEIFHNSSDPAHTCQRMASVHNSSDPAPTCQRMASVNNSSDPTPTRQRMALVQISSDPALECQTIELEHSSLSPGRNCLENVSHGDKTDTTSNELDLLFSLMFDELLNGSTKVVSKSSAVSAADAQNQRQQPTTPLNNH
nr:integrase, catalytic region, zinc finger, CCHC-type, peptidase aspartic, catalytic [Tanacetum cinerariifolium]